MKIKCYDISWDTDGEKVFLPKKVLLDIDMEDDIVPHSEEFDEIVVNDLSNLYGFCIFGCKIKILE